MLNLNLQNRQQFLTSFESWTEIPMLVLVLVMIVTLIVPLVVHLPESTHQVLEMIDWVIWALFALELSIRVYLADKKIAYLKKNWVDVIVVALPLLRVFRIFRAARLLRVLRFARILTLFGKFTAELKIILSRHHLHYLLGVLLGLIGIGSILIFHFDQGITGGNESLPDSIWLATINAFSGGSCQRLPSRS